MSHMKDKAIEQMNQNQCDGCNAGLPISDESIHTYKGYPMMYCQKDKYSLDDNDTIAIKMAIVLSTYGETMYHLLERVLIYDSLINKDKEDLLIEIQNFVDRIRHIKE